MKSSVESVFTPSSSSLSSSLLWSVPSPGISETTNTRKQQVHLSHRTHKSELRNMKILRQPLKRFFVWPFNVLLFKVTWGLTLHLRIYYLPDIQHEAADCSQLAAYKICVTSWESDRSSVVRRPIGSGTVLYFTVSTDLLSLLRYPNSAATDLTWLHLTERDVSKC